LTIVTLLCNRFQKLFISCIFLLYPPFPLLRIASFFHLNTWVHNISTISAPFPCIPPTGANLQTGAVILFCPLFLKKRHFCLFKGAVQEVSLWHFHVYIIHFKLYFPGDQSNWVHFMLINYLSIYFLKSLIQVFVPLSIVLSF
jgi:hypothetical protein